MRPANLDPIDITSLKNRLRSACFGQGEIHYLPTTGSTNNVARDLAEKSAPEGTIVIAESQTKGRGRLDRTWYSPPGTGLYFSIVLRPQLDPYDLPKITLLAGIAVAESIEETTGLHPLIKWPNDLLLEGKKVAGILTELYGDITSPYVILGIGINVHTRREEFLPELQEIATSLTMVGGQNISRANLMQAILTHLGGWYEIFKKGVFQPILDAWRKRCVIIGAHVKILSGEKELEGTVVDVDVGGALLLRDQSGQIRRILSGEVIRWEK
ncbi:MAG: biotin--[acetyl-CoA-carboxylase] ligase [Thermodesulfobacteriota bacterium]|nr:biotin--[acetyl-CoA-carboxylase] ligase [Thermodesulfobacteriota bacterium]